MKILVTGSKGQLGKTLLAKQSDDVTIVGVDLEDVDIAEADEVAALVKREKPDLIVNAAAYTAVDRAESEEHDSRRVNVFGARNLAATGVRLIHVSTDFVFDGEAREPYKPDDETNPLSVYGRSKRDGEIAVREISPEDGGNFVDTMLRLMRSRDELRVVNDQVGSPTWARSLADVCLAIAAGPWRPGAYHWTDGGQCSWYDFACAIHDDALEIGLLDKAVAVRPIPSAEYPVPAARPSYSVLDCTSTMAEFDVAQTPWRDNLRIMLEEMS